MVTYNFKSIRPVPKANDFIDIVLSKTQRKTPTVVHAGYKIGRIRAFYMRKVKFTQEAFCEKLSWILEDFPQLDDLHPFYSDLCNVLYDRDHYKLALGQLNVCKNLIAGISKDYVRLLKYGDTLYRCKQLKRAALGRMATLMKKHKSSLDYLEEVRKHLSRLPNIDPTSRTILITGYPNVGKSSFMNKVTRADVEVHDYAFTTKSLYVGHMDYKYLRYQVIDTPGILDKPLEERNTIEMQAVTALAHLQSCVLYFVDLSENCGWTLEEQAQLFDNIYPLFTNKPLLIIANKIDIAPIENLSEEHKALLESMKSKSGADIIPMSGTAEMNIAQVKERACEILLEKRIEMKTKSSKVNNILNRLTVVQPQRRDDVARPPTIPEAVLQKREELARKQAKGEDADDDQDEDGDVDMGEKKKTERDLMWENGGPGVYNCDYRKYYMLPNDEEKYDTIPWVMDGKNIHDFIDPEIMEKLEALEKEEEERAARENAELEQYENGVSDLDEEEKDLITKIRRKKKQIVAKHRMEKNKNRSTIPRTKQKQSKQEMEEKLRQRGFDEDVSLTDNGRGRKRERSLGPSSRSESTRAAESEARSRSRTRGRSLSQAASVRDQGLGTVQMKEQARKRMKHAQKAFQNLGKAGESDRKVLTKMPKHLFAGKRKMGKTDRR